MSIAEMELLAIVELSQEVQSRGLTDKAVWNAGALQLAVAILVRQRAVVDHHCIGIGELQTIQCSNALRCAVAVGPL